MKLKNVDMLSGSISSGLIALAVPIMIMNIMNTVFNIIDMAVLRTYSTDSAVGAVGVCGTLISLATSILTGASVGANVVIAKRIGEKNREKAGNSALAVISFSIVASIVIAIFGVIFAERVLVLTNCPETLLSRATSYFKIYFIGLPFNMFYVFCAAILRAAGDAKRPMLFMILGGMIKVAFTFLFAAGFDMGVDGVASATVIANLIIGVLAIFAILRMKQIFSFRLQGVSVFLFEIKETLKVGIPSGFNSAIFALMNLLITACVNTLGAAAATGVAIGSQFDNILYCIVYAHSLAVTPYVAQNMGAQNIRRVKKTVGYSCLITIAFGVVFGAILLALAKPLACSMTSSPEVVKFALQRMVIISSTYFICGIQDVFFGVLRGIGKPVIPTVVTLVCVCPLRIIWIYFIFPLLPSITFLYAVFSIEWALTSIVQIIIYLHWCRKTNPKIAN